MSRFETATTAIAGSATRSLAVRSSASGVTLPPILLLLTSP